MISRTITLAGNPNVQIVLYFQSRSNAEKSGIETLDHAMAKPKLVFEDDFKQRVLINRDAVIITDIITDATQMFEVNGKLEIGKMIGAKHMEEKINADPLLKMWLEIKQREDAMRRRGQVMMQQA